MISSVVGQVHPNLGLARYKSVGYLAIAELRLPFSSTSSLTYPGIMERKPSRPSRSRAVSRYQYQRAYQACIPCARHKTKCKRSDNAITCERCEKKGIRCMSSSKRPWSRSTPKGNKLNTYSPLVTPDAETDPALRMREIHDVDGSRSPSWVHLQRYSL